MIVGAGGHGKVVADIAEATGKYIQVAFADDKKTGYFNGYKILGNLLTTKKWIGKSEFIAAVGDNLARKNIQSKLIENGATFATLIHPKAIKAEDVWVGNGTVIMAGVVINSGSAIGDGVILNTGCTVDHDNCIKDYVHLSPGCHTAGGVSIGEKTWLGIGSIVRNNIKICAQCVLGAGTVVVEDIKEFGTYVGVPARRGK